jgi:hypothetical protein
MRKITDAENAYTKKQSAERRRQRFQSQKKRAFGVRGNGPLLHKQPERADGYKAGNQRPKKDFAVRMASCFEQPKRRKRANDGAKRVHQSLEAKRPAVCLGSNIRSKQRLSRRRPHAAAEPRSGSANQEMIGMRCESKRRRAKRRDQVSENCERLAAFQPVRIIACSKLRKARKAVSHSFDGPKPRGPRANHREKRGQDRCCRFVAPIAKETGEADAENGAVEPGLFFCRFGHSEAVYSRQLTVNSPDRKMKIEIGNGKPRSQKKKTKGQRLTADH